jgi:hypothetical protein
MQIISYYNRKEGVIMNFIRYIIGEIPEEIVGLFIMFAFFIAVYWLAELKNYLFLPDAPPPTITMKDGTVLYWDDGACMYFSEDGSEGYDPMEGGLPAGDY